VSVDRTLRLRTMSRDSSAVYRWRVEFDPKVGRKQHKIAGRFGHALLAPVVSHVFRVLRLSANLWEHGMEWLPIHTEPNPLQLVEIEHGLERERYRYNGECFARVKKTKKALRGEHGGYCDLFVPVQSDGKVVAILVTGPFALARPTSAEILERWHRLVNRQGHPQDPEFAAYLSFTFGVLVLDGGGAKKFERLLGCLAELMAGEGRADALVNEAEVLSAELERARFVDRTWDEVQALVDERTSLAAHSLANDTILRYLGLPRTADSALVGLTVKSGRPIDAVEEAVRRDALQRRAVDLAHRFGDTIAGRVGDHGVVFLSAAEGTAQKKRQRLFDLAARVSAVARKDFGLTVHFGGSVGGTRLSRPYQAALGAAELALSKGVHAVFADPNAPRLAHPLGRLRRELGRLVAERPERLAPQFDRYLEAVAAQCAGRMDAARGHLEAGFERLAEPLVGTGALDEKSFGSLAEELERAAGEARTLSDLFSAYRRAVVSLTEAVTRPVPARRDLGVRRAVDYIHRHYTEPLRLGQAARIAGITPDYFSKLFKERERVTFAQYVTRLRLERAKELLIHTGLGVGRIAEMSGFSAPEYLSRVFRRATGVAPLEYRNMPPRARTRKRP
jgi:AraC-like DNA-binding protein